MAVAINWPAIRLVVFDVDGTLYSQRPLRLKMAAALLRSCVASFDPTPLRVLRVYRALREELAEQEVANFDAELVGRVAARFGRSEGQVRKIVDTWIDKAPLPHLRACRYEGVAEFFDAIRTSGRQIGILSDYPAKDKLRALGLDADFVSSAVDPEIGMLKPNPRGLLHLMDRAGARAHETILIGDRRERDGEAGRRAGVATYLRTSKSLPDSPCFDSYVALLDGSRHALGPAAAAHA